MKGTIYILTNEAMPGLIKIGITENENVQVRIKQLHNKTCVPFPFELRYAIKVDDFKTKERMIHALFEDSRKNMNREFFEMDPEKAILALQLTGGEEIVIENYDKELYDQKEIKGIEENRKKRRENFNFSKLGISIGAELFYIKDDAIKCTVIPDNRVSYEDEKYSLSGLTCKLENKDNQSGPSPLSHWFYKNDSGEELILSAIRNKEDKNK